MRKNPNATEAIRQYIRALPAGEPFASRSLLDCGSRAAVDQALSRMVRAGEITRLARGLFVRPEVNRFIGKVMPDTTRVLEVLAKARGEIIQPHGAEAARRLQLSTQVPTRPVFLTSGPSRRLRLGLAEVWLQHSSRLHAELAGQPAGLALTALDYLGRRAVTTESIEKVRSSLAESEFQQLMRSRARMPGWLSDVFTRYQQRSLHG